MTATPAQLDVIRLLCELAAPGYASLEYQQEVRARLRTALIAMDVEAELTEQSMAAFDPAALAELQRNLDQTVRNAMRAAARPDDVLVATKRGAIPRGSLNIPMPAGAKSPRKKPPS